VPTIQEVALNTDHLLYFLAPDDGSESVLVEEVTQLRKRGGYGSARAFIRDKYGVDPLVVVGSLPARFMTQVAYGCYRSRELLYGMGRRLPLLVAEEHRNGAWVRTPRKHTGRGPHGDAIRYEPGLPYAVLWADKHLAALAAPWGPPPTSADLTAC
jgi:hypothetical protein